MSLGKGRVQDERLPFNFKAFPPNFPLVSSFFRGHNTRAGPLAQLVEQLTLNQRVAGSSPSRFTTSDLDLWCLGTIGYFFTRLTLCLKRLRLLYTPSFFIINPTMHYYRSILETAGHTPLVRLKKIEERFYLPFSLYGKV